MWLYNARTRGGVAVSKVLGFREKDAEPVFRRKDGCPIGLWVEKSKLVKVVELAALEKEFKKIECADRIKTTEGWHDLWTPADVALSEAYNAALKKAACGRAKSPKKEKDDLSEYAAELFGLGGRPTKAERKAILEKLRQVKEAEKDA